MKTNYTSASQIPGTFKKHLLPAKAMLLALGLFLLSATQIFVVIALRGIATTGTTSSTSLTINISTSLVAGDLMIVNIAKGGNN